MANKKRLSFLSSLLKGYDTVLDIGTDHGLVLKEAIDLGYIKKGIAADIGELPLKSAMKNLRGYDVEFIQSDGFKDIKSTYDAVLIAGMGVYTIMDILNEPHLENIYFLQPNDKHDVLRVYLMENGYRITDEYVIYDKFYYVIIKAIKGKMILTDEDIYVGPLLKTKKQSKKYYQSQIKRIERIIEVADEATKIRNEQILNYYKKNL